MLRPKAPASPHSAAQPSPASLPVTERFGLVPPRPFRKQLPRWSRVLPSVVPAGRRDGTTAAATRGRGASAAGVPSPGSTAPSPVPVPQDAPTQGRSCQLYPVELHQVLQWMESVAG